jgi:hypothetical protein
MLISCLPTDVRSRRPRLVCPQQPSGLLFCELSLLHPPSPYEDGLYQKMEEFVGLRSTGRYILAL